MERLMEPRAENECQMCMQQFSSVEEFGNHVNKDHKGHDSWYSCPECYDVFDHRYRLSSHMTTKHGVKAEPFLCPIEGCDERLSRLSLLRKHLEVKHTVNPIESFHKFSEVDAAPSMAPARCPVEGCHKLLARRYQLIRHIKQVHNVDPQTVIVDEERRPVDISSSVVNSIVVCGDGGNDNLSSTTYMNRKSSRVRVKCPYEGCGKTVVDRHYLQSHIKRVHKADPQDVLPEKPIPERVAIARRKSSTITYTPTVSASKLKAQLENMDDQKKSEIVSDDDDIPPAKRTRGNKQDNATEDGVGVAMQPFKCPFDGCTLLTFRKDYIQKHLAQVHKVTNPKDFFPRHRPKDRDGNIPTRDPILCGFEGCRTVLGNRTRLNRHIRDVHKGDPLNWEVIYPPPPPASTPTSAPPSGQDKPVPPTMRDVEKEDKGDSQKGKSGCGKLLNKSSRHTHIRNIHKADPPVLGQHKKLPPNVLVSRRRLTTTATARKIKDEVSDDDDADSRSSPSSTDDEEEGCVEKDTELFTCPVDGCLTRMSRTSHLKRHIKSIHNVDPMKYFPPKRKVSSKVPVMCGFEDCGKVLSRTSTLNLHIKNIHKGNPRDWEVIDPQQEELNGTLCAKASSATATSTTTKKALSRPTRKLRGKRKYYDENSSSSSDDGETSTRTTHYSKLEYDTTTVNSAPSSPSESDSSDEDVILGF